MIPSGTAARGSRLFAVVPRRDAVFLLEGILEVVAVGEAAAQGDLGDGVPGGDELLGGMVEADEDDVLVQANNTRRS